MDAGVFVTVAQEVGCNAGAFVASAMAVLKVVSSCVDALEAATSTASAGTVAALEVSLSCTSALGAAACAASACVNAIAASAIAVFDVGLATIVKESCGTAARVFIGITGRAHCSRCPALHALC